MGASVAETPAAEAIPLLLERHGGRIYALGLRMCGDPADAQDLVQETFLSAFRHWQDFEGRSQASTWLYTIAARACRRMQRRRSGEPSHMASLEELMPERGGAIPALDHLADDPLAEQIRRESRERVATALAAIPPSFRIPLVLKDVVGLSLAEIGRALGVKEATVKTRVHRARLALRKALADGLPQRPAAAAEHERAVCLDLLRAKQEAMDRGVPLAVPDADLCTRCRALFATLDLARDTCLQIARGELPEPLRRLVLAAISREAAGDPGAAKGPADDPFAPR
jgi:RNA polymerase sigma-70 factor (ECF subfamily)